LKCRAARLRSARRHPLHGTCLLRRQLCLEQQKRMLEEEAADALRAGAVAPAAPAGAAERARLQARLGAAEADAARLSERVRSLARACAWSVGPAHALLTRAREPCPACMEGARTLD